MNAPYNQTTAQQIELNGLLYCYTIQPVEIKNMLGIATATLQEYNLKGTAGDQILLYKTIEGSWYDLEQPESKFKNAIIQSLKFAIDEKENSAIS